jgi:hypothetical protein
LNLHDRCGVYEDPRKMWKRGRCPGYENEPLLAKYKADLERKQVKMDKEERRARMKLRQTEPHWQGVRSGHVSVH